ncbi:MAG: nucleotidyltransferase domain-containing protein [Candidatus Woesearchaeota archaeon]
MLQYCNIFKTAAVFFDEPTKQHYLMEISRKAKLAHTSVKNHIIQLERSKIIIKQIEKKGKRKFPVYITNINEQPYKEAKQLYNLYSLRASNLIDHLKNTFYPDCIVVFGSYRRGDDTEQSDIDIYLEAEEQDYNLRKFENYLNRKIELHFRRPFKECPQELKNNIINGILLYGYLGVFQN